MRTTSTIAETAALFFDACETGKGWEGCEEYCHADATFSAQAEPLADIRTLRDYTNWMQGLLGFMPDGRYEIRSLGIDEDRSNVAVFGVLSGTHTGEGGPLPPTGKSTKSDYVYVMEFEDGRIRHMTKIWNAPFAMKELGWM